MSIDTKRLREIPRFSRIDPFADGQEILVGRLCHDAADEIDRLRERLDSILREKPKKTGATEVRGDGGPRYAVCNKHPHIHVTSPTGAALGCPACEHDATEAKLARAMECKEDAWQVIASSESPTLRQSWLDKWSDFGDDKRVPELPGGGTDYTKGDGLSQRHVPEPE